MKCFDGRPAAGELIRILSRGPVPVCYPPEASDALIKAASDHALVPHLGHAIFTLHRTTLASPFDQTLQASILLLAARSEALMALANTIHTAFAGNGINRPLLIKGPALALQAFGDISRRQYDDLDFILSGPDIPAATCILKEMGFVPVLDLSADEHAFQVAHGWGIAFRHKQTGHLVELDTGLGPRYLGLSITATDLAEGALCVQDSGCFLTTRPEITLVTACIHGCKHQWERLAWLMDIAGLVQNQAMDWNVIGNFCRQHGVRKAIAGGLRLVEHMDLANLPAGARSCISPCVMRVQDLDQQTTAILSAGKDPGDRPATCRTCHPMFRMLDSPLRHYTHGCRLLTTPSLADHQWHPLPRNRWWIYRILRPVRLAAQWIGLHSR